MRYDGRRYETWEELDRNRRAIQQSYEYTSTLKHLAHLLFCALSFGLWIPVYLFVLYGEHIMRKNLKHDMEWMLIENKELLNKWRAERDWG